jgi:hypothetical protein
MAVLCQAVTVVAEVETIEAKYPRGLDGFLSDSGGIRYSDGLLGAASFMSPPDVRRYVAGLIDLLGFEFVDDSRRALDVVVIDQETGPTANCDWVVTRVIDDVRWAWKAGCDPGQLIAYAGWTIDVYQSMHFVPNEEVRGLVSGPTEDPSVRSLIDPTDGSVRFIGSPDPEERPD